MKRFLLVFICVILLAAIVTWYAITQPLFGSDETGNSPVPLVVKDLADDLQRHVKKLSVDLVPRDYRSVATLDEAGEYIRAELAKSNGEVSLQAFNVKGQRYYNIIAAFGPLTAERIVIGAHYNSYEKLPGADDNASGVAGLIALADMLKNATLKHRVELVAYTLEEPPYFRTENMGSYVHAHRLAAERASVKLMISLECIGYFTDAPSTQDFPVPGLGMMYPTAGNFIAIVGRYQDRAYARAVKRAMSGATKLPAHSISAPAFVQGIDFSDQLNYWAEGFPALMITDTAFFRNKAYHTKDDTFDRLDYQRMADVVRGAYAAVMAVNVMP